MPTGRRSLVAFIASLLSAVPLAGQAAASRIRPPSVLPVTAIAITGNKTLRTDAIRAVLGLTLHENGSPAVFDAARDRLLDTGYFDSVGYSFRQQDLGFSITFNVTEMKQLYPVAVEGLPITKDRVEQILRSKDPLFSGMLPGVNKVIERAAAAVEESLAASNPRVRVRARVVPIAPDRYVVQFSPAEGLPAIADVTFEGSSVIKDADLHDVMIENGIGQPFSEDNIRALLDRLIRPLFEKEGYMRVSFPKITHQPAAGVKGIDVHVTVADGPRFKLGTVSVRGPMAADSKRILGMANLPRSAYVNADDLKKGATRIRDSLRSEGYLDASVAANRAINDASKTVDYWYEVKPGDVYTFGRLTVKGLGLDGEAAIRKMWSVKPGEPFPGGYPEHFSQTVKQEGLFDNLGAITATPSIDRQSRVVDVTLTFAGAPPAAPRPQTPY